MAKLQILKDRFDIDMSEVLTFQQLVGTSTRSAEYLEHSGEIYEGKQKQVEVEQVDIDPQPEPKIAPIATPNGGQ